MQQIQEENALIARTLEEVVQILHEQHANPFISPAVWLASHDDSLMSLNGDDK